MEMSQTVPRLERLSGSPRAQVTCDSLPGVALPECPRVALPLARNSPGARAAQRRCWVSESGGCGSQPVTCSLQATPERHIVVATTLPCVCSSPKSGCPFNPDSCVPTGKAHQTTEGVGSHPRSSGT